MTFREDPEFLVRSSATTLRERLGRGDIMASDVALAFLARVEARDDDVRAWAYIDRATVLAQADALDGRAASGAPLGPLHGIPVGIKDIILTEDQPTGCNRREAIDSLLA